MSFLHMHHLQGSFFSFTQTLITLYPSVIRKAAEEKVITFSLTPHTSYETQQRDKEPFGPLKTF